MGDDGSHRDHAAIGAVVRGWFTSSAPEIGYEVEATWYGFLGRLDGFGSRAIVTVDDPAQVLDALADVVVATAAERSPVVIWVDDRSRSATIGPALVAAGCSAGRTTTHLALVGSVRTSDTLHDLTMQRVDPRQDEAFDVWARVKIQCFDDAEDAPAPERIEREITVRRNEAPLADYVLASLSGEPVAVIGYYRGRDQLVFNLGTRVPYRHRGIAQTLLRRLSEQGERDGCRSLVINATEGGAPEALYRRLGFSDEVYWYQLFELPESR